jgi:hypothetical protein
LASKTNDEGSIPSRGAIFCVCGGMVYTADLKSAAIRHAGSSPARRTIDLVCRRDSSSVDNTQTMVKGDGGRGVIERGRRILVA